MAIPKQGPPEKRPLSSLLTGPNQNLFAPLSKSLFQMLVKTKSWLNSKANINIHKENQQLKSLTHQLRFQLKQSKDRSSEAERLLLMIQRQCGEDIINVEMCCSFIKKCQRNGCSHGEHHRHEDQGHRQTTEQLKRALAMAEINNSKREIADWLKQNQLRIPKGEQDQMIKLRVLKR